jgi:hypothetical protein
MPCKCNTAQRDPDCTNPHRLNELLVDRAFPNLDRGPSGNPNPMNSRCGLEDCDCEYTIGGLLRRLEMIIEQADLTVKQTRAEPCPRECDDTCPCFRNGIQEGYEYERRPPGA